VNDSCALDDWTFCAHYSLQEYHPAGDLHTLLLMKGSRLDAVRFYMAELMCTHHLCPSCPSSTFIHQLIALEYIHSKRVVHRDIKPENVFIDIDGHIVLGDFGLAHKLGAGQDTISSNEMFSTPAYTPPEVFSGRLYGREVDIWAFGVMLYELITGKVCLCALIFVQVTDISPRKHSSRLQFLRTI
jgi:serine/threonine protein kinase